MQYHLNGYQTGDPNVYNATKKANYLQKIPSKVDVLIIGCGPAGLTLAAQLVSFPEISVCIIDMKPGPLEIGQADGIACRTVEMFEAFGFSEKVLKEAYWVNETTFWKPNAKSKKHIIRSGRIQDTEDDLSEFPHVILNQARVHDFYLDIMKNSVSGLSPHYNRKLLNLNLNKSEEYPVHARIEQLGDSADGKIDTIKARFVVGCEGARSVVRETLGLQLYGDSANKAWGVMDVLAVTDFPDIRLKSLIQSASDGNLLIIPREGGYMVRLYIEMDKLNKNERVSNKRITSSRLVRVAQNILYPYKFDVKEIAWWSVYEIGQRLSESFDDTINDEIENARVFIAGDACHTHSPKAGQGMNVSMADTFNLGWKIAAVLRGQSKPELLKTYSFERQRIAQELIDFDREFAEMFSATPKSEIEPNGVDPEEFKKYFIRHGHFTAGIATCYPPSVIQGERTFQCLAKGLRIGTRFHSARVIRLADAKPCQLGHSIKADGRWRLFIFSGLSGIQNLCDFLEKDKASPIVQFTPEESDIDALIDVRAVFQEMHREFDISTVPSLLRPRKGNYNLIDYEKVYCSNINEKNNIFDLRGIDRFKGCIVIIRPDQYISHILPINAYEDISNFFNRFMLKKV